MEDRFAASWSKLESVVDEPTVQVVTPVRPELHRALRVKAAEEGTTIRVLVMRGLRAIGLPVSALDEQDRRGARGNRRRGRSSHRTSTHKEVL